MRTIFTTMLAASVMAAVAADARAQVPGEVSFTARLVNNGTPLDGAAQVRLQLFDSATSTTSLWTETHSATADKGLVAIRLGAQTTLDDSIVDGGPLFLVVTVDNQVLTPRLPIGSVPYAMMAGRASTLGTLGETDVQRRITNMCTTGSAAVAVGATGTLTCAPTDYTFGTGLSLSGRSVTINPSVVQTRVSGSCAAGQSIRAIAADGTVTCEVDSDTGIATATGTNGITASVTGTNIAISTDSTVQRRTVAPSCPTGQYLRSIASTGAPTCVPALTCTRVTSTATPTTAAAACPTGNIVMGGGCQSPNNTDLLDSYPSATGWACRTTSFSPVQAIAICCDVSF